MPSAARVVISSPSMRGNSFLFLATCLSVNSVRAFPSVLTNLAKNPVLSLTVRGKWGKGTASPARREGVLLLRGFTLRMCVSLRPRGIPGRRVVRILRYLRLFVRTLLVSFRRAGPAFDGRLRFFPNIFPIFDFAFANSNKTRFCARLIRIFGWRLRYSVSAKTNEFVFALDLFVSLFQRLRRCPCRPGGPALLSGPAKRRRAEDGYCRNGPPEINTREK